MWCLVRYQDANGLGAMNVRPDAQLHGQGQKAGAWHCDLSSLKKTSVERWLLRDYYYPWYLGDFHNPWRGSVLNQWGAPVWVFVTPQGGKGFGGKAAPGGKAPGGKAAHGGKAPPTQGTGQFLGCQWTRSCVGLKHPSFWAVTTFLTHTHLSSFKKELFPTVGWWLWVMVAVLLNVLGNMSCDPFLLNVDVVVSAGFLAAARLRSTAICSLEGKIASAMPWVLISEADYSWLFAKNGYLMI